MPIHTRNNAEITPNYCRYIFETMPNYTRINAELKKMYQILTVSSYFNIFKKVYFVSIISLNKKIMATRIYTSKELYTSNTIAAKQVSEKRSFSTINQPITKTIKRTRYLKICWMCGSIYESNKYNTYACSPRCTQNIIYARKRDVNPPINMVELIKPKNVKEIKERFGYL